MAAMFYIRRNVQGAIESVSTLPDAGAEAVDDDASEVRQFLSRGRPDGFVSADADFVRVLEDVIDTLIAKNVLQHTDLPAAAQQKLLARKGLRSRLHDALNLLGEDDPLL